MKFTNTVNDQGINDVPTLPGVLDDFFQLTFRHPRIVLQGHGLHPIAFINVPH